MRQPCAPVALAPARGETHIKDMPHNIGAHGPPQRVRAGGHVWNMRAAALGQPPYVLIPPMLDTTPKRFADMRPPGNWNRGLWIGVRQVTEEEFWSAYITLR
jgi:hypothetical protein